MVADLLVDAFPDRFIAMLARIRCKGGILVDYLRHIAACLARMRENPWAAFDQADQTMIRATFRRVESEGSRG